MTTGTTHRIRSKHKTKCGQWIGQLPRGEYVTGDASRVTCTGCK
jgi:hypothetical protein